MAQAKIAPALMPHLLPAQCAGCGSEAGGGSPKSRCRACSRASRNWHAITTRSPRTQIRIPRAPRSSKAVAKKNGFASYEEYNTSSKSQPGCWPFDPTSKKYVGAENRDQAQIAEVNADKKMSAKVQKER